MFAGVVREALVLTKKRQQSVVVTLPSTNPQALSCISDMVQGLGTPFHCFVLELLDSMLLSGLSQELIDTLAVIAINMPSQVTSIQFYHS